MSELREVDAPAVLELYQWLESAGVPVWLDGGWCVDALIGRQTRPHADLDIAVERRHAPQLQTLLLGRGYRHCPRPDTTEWNFALERAAVVVDVHVFEYDQAGRNVYGIEYPFGALTGRGVILQTAVRCVAPEWMLTFKTAFAPREKDLVDLEALRAHFKGAPMTITFAGFELLRRLDAGGDVEYFAAQSASGQQPAKRLLIRMPPGDRGRWPGWADPALANVLVHPNVMRLFECAVAERRPFALLEYVDGLDLRELLAKGPLSVDLACFVVSEACRGVGAALSAVAPDGTPLRWSHRRLTPRQLMLSSDGGVKVAGFGVGALKPEQSTVTQQVEALGFLAPEDVASHAPEWAGPRLDVFSLGAVLQAACAGAPFEPAASPREYLAHLQERVRHAATLSQLGDPASLELRAVVAKMLAVQPAERFADAGEAGRALDAVPELQRRGELQRQLARLVQQSHA